MKMKSTEIMKNFVKEHGEDLKTMWRSPEWNKLVFPNPKELRNPKNESKTEFIQNACRNLETVMEVCSEHPMQDEHDMKVIIALLKSEARIIIGEAEKNGWYKPQQTD